MAQAIKYNTGSKTASCCIRKGNYDIGIVQNYVYGPTSSTNFYAGYTVPTGGFLSFQNKASQGPSIYEIPTSSDLVQFGKNLNLGGTYNTASSVIKRCSEINTIVLVNIDYPELPAIDNNIFTLDAGYTASYPWEGSTWLDIAGGSVTQGNLSGTTSWQAGNSGVNYVDSYMNFDALSENAWVSTNTFGSLTQFTVNVWVKPIATANFGNNVNVFGQRYSTASNYNPQSNCNFLIRGNGSNGFEGLVRVSGTDYTVDFGAITVGSWSMLTLTLEPSQQLSTFVNGTPKNVTSIVGTPSSNGLATLIGGTTNGINNNGNPTNYFNGYIAVVNIYDIYIDPSGLYNSYSSRY